MYPSTYCPIYNLIPCPIPADYSNVSKYLLPCPSNLILCSIPADNSNGIKYLLPWNHVLLLCHTYILPCIPTYSNGSKYYSYVLTIYSHGSKYTSMSYLPTSKFYVLPTYSQVRPTFFSYLPTPILSLSSERQRLLLASPLG